MAQVLDFSSGPPSGKAVHDAGYDGVVRYAGTPGRPKNITRNEFLDMARNGLGVALVFENQAGDALNGYGAGQAAARAIRADANNIGFPSDHALYFACDRDVVTEPQFAAVMSYLDGAASVLGGAHLVGVYGEHDVVKRALEGGHARYGWQTVAWSRGVHYDGAHLYQLAGYVYPGGVQCDASNVLQANWGQHNYVEADMLQDERDALFRNKEILEVLNNFPGGVAAIGPTLLRVVEILEVFNAFPGGVAAIGPALLDLAGRSAAAVDEAALAQHLISQGYGAGATVEQVKSALAGLRFVTS